MAPPAQQLIGYANEFMLVAPYQRWLCFSGPDRKGYNPSLPFGIGTGSSYTSPETLADDDNLKRLYTGSPFSERKGEGKEYTGIRLSLVDKNLNPAGDGVLTNDKRKYQILPAEHATFMYKGTAFLLLTHQFPSKGKGLLLITGAPKGFHADDVLVYEQYNYLLPQLQQTTNESVLIPFLYKGKAGIMKITM